MQKQTIYNIIESILNILYPKYTDKEIEEKYKENLKAINLIKVNQNENTKIYFEHHIYLFKYDGLIREKIIDYKFNDRVYLNETFVNFILKNEKICRFLKSYDIITPVPIHQKRKKQRGYNQSEIIAKKIAKNIQNLELVTDCLIKQKNTVAQSSLNKEQRKQNIKNVYILKNKQKINNKNIVIFDDIYTTGSTVNECAKLLKEANANKILVLTIAKD